MTEKLIKTSRFYFHFLFWIIYYGIEFYIEFYNKIFTETSVLRYTLGIILFYFLLEILKKSDIFFKIGFILLTFLAFLLLSLLLKYQTFNLFQTFIDPPISVQILYIIDNFAHLFFIAYILNIYQSLLKSHSEAVLIENQLFEIETFYLNSKIDTHFFMNTINLFYSQSLINEPVSALKLLKLADFVKKNL